MNLSNKLVVILGPTAVGKTKFGSQLAYRFNGEIISADSRQVYIGMDIGTGKDLEDYEVNNKRINTHLIDIIKPHCEFNLYLFTQLFQTSFEEIHKENYLPFLVGGTGLYLSAILHSYRLQTVDFNSERTLELKNLEVEELKNILLAKNRNLHNTTDLIDKERIINAILIAENKNEFDKKNFKISPLVIGLQEGREILKARIQKRLKARLQSGMIEEVVSSMHDLRNKNGLIVFPLNRCQDKDRLMDRQGAQKPTGP